MLMCKDVHMLWKDLGRGDRQAGLKALYKQEVKANTQLKPICQRIEGIPQYTELLAKNRGVTGLRCVRKLFNH